ncbi:MAG TPA: STAS domain-containing protein [Capsulimonadaceae bacterium]|jgi:rsbT co-antagonist protein RsbR
MNSKLSEVLTADHEAILADWLQEQAASSVRRVDLIKDSEARDESREFLRLFTDSIQMDLVDGIEGSSWETMREFLRNLSRTRAQLGFTPTEVATFVFSFRKVIFPRLRAAYGSDSDDLFADLTLAAKLIDDLGLYTTEMYQKTRDEIIVRQQQDMLELSTPVVKLWNGILAVPLIGTLDSARTQVVMENLLQAIVSTGSSIAIIDITGVPTVDTLVSQHLLKTVAAARLMGAECIISGIRPAIAQTIVHLGVDLSAVLTKATLADAFTVALTKIGRQIVRVKAGE